MDFFTDLYSEKKYYKTSKVSKYQYVSRISTKGFPLTFPLLVDFSDQQDITITLLNKGDASFFSLNANARELYFNGTSVSAEKDEYIAYVEISDGVASSTLRFIAKVEE
jgi:hypothetical protein